MDGGRPRDWSRFEREMRIWGRRFERDMQNMGERIERDMSAAGRTRAGGFCGPGSSWMFETGDCGRDARRAARHAARHAARSARYAARDAGRAAADGVRAASRSGRCGSGGGLWAWWWVAFPVFFMGKSAFEDAGGFAGMTAGVQDFWAWSLQLTFVSPVAGLIAKSLNMTYEQAYGLLALSAIICAGAALIGWRAGRPQATSTLAG